MSEETLLDKAKQKFNVAITLKNHLVGADDAYLNYVGYHLQQAVELALKFCLEMNGVDYPRNHDITQLIACCNANNVDWI